MRRLRHRSLALVVVVKVALVGAIVALPSWFAVSLGAAHGVALALVATGAAVVVAVGALRRRRLRAGGTAALTAEARIETANASRYLVHLCRHATKIGERRRHGHPRGDHTRPDVLGAEFSDTRGTIDLSWGRCVLDAEPDALTVRVEAATGERLRVIQDIVAADLERFGHRDDLTVAWTPTPAP